MTTPADCMLTDDFGHHDRDPDLGSHHDQHDHVTSPADCGPRLIVIIPDHDRARRIDHHLRDENSSRLAVRERDAGRS